MAAKDQMVKSKDGDIHAWLIVAASTFIYYLSGTMTFIQGLLLREFLVEFEAGEVATAWLPGIFLGIMQFSAIVACWVSDLIEYQTMTVIGSAVVSVGLICSSFVTNLKLFYFTYSVLIGLGCGFQFVPAVIVPQMCIKKRRALAIAITMSGAPLGAFISCPLFQFLINRYEWRGAMQITGAFVLHGCAFGLMLVPPKDLIRNKSYPDLRKQNDIGSTEIYNTERMSDPTVSSMDKKLHETIMLKLKSIFDASVLKSGILIFVALQWMLFCMGFPVVHTFLPVVSSVYGINEDTVSLMLSVVGISDFVGRLSYGAVASTQKIKSVYLLCTVGTLSGAAYLCLTWVRPLAVMCVFLVIIGANTGGWVTCANVALVDLFGIEKVAKCYGFMQIGQSIAFLSSTPLHAVFVEATATPPMAFSLAGLLQCSGSLILMFYFRCVHGRKTTFCVEKTKGCSTTIA